MLSTLKVTSPRYLSKMTDEVCLDAAFELVFRNVQQSSGLMLCGEVCKAIEAEEHHR